MSTIVCATGPIDSGKTEFCNLVRQEEPNSIGLESGALIIEIANEMNSYLRINTEAILTGTDYSVPFNHALSRLEENHPQLFSGDINFTANDLLNNPEQFETLHAYINAIKMQPGILTERITAYNKDITYRPLLKWIGRYMVYKLSPTVWFDEVGRRISHFQPAPAIITVNALRYPADEKSMRSFAESNGYECIVVEVMRPGTEEGKDVTESSRQLINTDVDIVNNGTIEDLAKVAKDFVHDVKKRKVKSAYRAQ